jgi:LuxR family transcriptional regulator, quorum-sensing system regulator BjaR1
MAQIGFASIQGFSETCMKATRPEHIAARLGLMARQLGYTTWYAGSLLHERDLAERGFGFYDGSPQWSKHYTDEGYCFIDPVFLAARNNENAIRWSDCARSLTRERTDKKALLVLNEAREFGIRDGFTKAWHGFGEVQGVVTFGGERPDVSEDARMSLLLMGAFAYEGFRRVTDGFKPVPPILTQREADVLRWAAEGKTAWEIGQILTIAERTVRCYMDQLKRKYRVPTVVQVVVMALLDGNLRIQSTRQN